MPPSCPRTEYQELEVFLFFHQYTRIPSVRTPFAMRARSLPRRHNLAVYYVTGQTLLFRPNANTATVPTGRR